MTPFSWYLLLLFSGVLMILLVSAQIYRVLFVRWSPVIGWLTLVTGGIIIFMVITAIGATTVMLLASLLKGVTVPAYLGGPMLTEVWSPALTAWLLTAGASVALVGWLMFTGYVCAWAQTELEWRAKDSTTLHEVGSIAGIIFLLCLWAWQMAATFDALGALWTPK